jgi:uncharacterized membrane protein
VGSCFYYLQPSCYLFCPTHSAWSNALRPPSHILHLDHSGDMVGVGATTALSILILVLVSFTAGIIARTSIGTRISRWSERAFLTSFPQYRLVKSMTESLAHLENASSLRPALVSIEGGWQIGYLFEQLEGDWVAVFLPQAPTPMAGDIMYFPSSRVRPLDVSMVQTMSIVRMIGAGSAEALRGVDLKQPDR